MGIMKFIENYAGEIDMKNSLNVLMLTHKHKFGSFARSHAMARQLVQRGHHVSIMLISPNRRFGFKEYDWDGVHLIESPDLLWGRFRTGWDPWGTINRIFYLNKQNHHAFDLIHSFETRPQSIYPARFLSAKEPIPIITDWNDWWGHHGLVEVNRPAWYRMTYLSVVETYYEEAFRASAAGLTVIANALVERAVDLGVNLQHICYIPGGAFIDKYQVKTIAECRQYAGLDPEGLYLGFGSADSHLDMEIVMASISLVAQKCPRVKLLITGSAKPEIHQMVHKYGLEEQVKFLGFLSWEDYPWYMGASDLFLLPMADRPYNYGRWPNKMGDYLAFGRPTISNPIGDIKTLFEKYDIGLLAAYTPLDFAEKIMYLLDHRDQAAQMGQNARWVAENIYDWRILSEKLESFYYKIINKKYQVNVLAKSETGGIV
jgi:glycosyltransferase involved in cell wall biosynthesis